MFVRATYMSQWMALTVMLSGCHWEGLHRTQAGRQAELANKSTTSPQSAAAKSDKTEQSPSRGSIESTFGAGLISALLNPQPDGSLVSSDDRQRPNWLAFSGSQDRVAKHREPDALSPAELRFTRPNQELASGSETGTNASEIPVNVRQAYQEIPNEMPVDRRGPDYYEEKPLDRRDAYEEMPLDRRDAYEEMPVDRRGPDYYEEKPLDRRDAYEEMPLEDRRDAYEGMPVDRRGPDYYEEKPLDGPDAYEEKSLGWPDTYQEMPNETPEQFPRRRREGYKEVPRELPMGRRDGVSWAVHFEDPSAEERFGHGADYSWLQGQLEYRYQTREWRIRYASFSEEDRFGGCLALEGLDPDDSWKEGDWVYVEGMVPEGKPDSSKPVYHVYTARSLTP